MTRLRAGTDVDGRAWYVDVTTFQDLVGGADNMLTNCGCIANPDQTQILRACQLHEAWAKAKYDPPRVTTGQRRAEDADATR